MNEELFNSKFNYLVQNYVLKDENHSVCNQDATIFVFLNDFETISLANLRVLFIAKFLSKFLKLSRTIINVLPKKLQEKCEVEAKLKNLFEKFKLNFEINIIDINELRRRFNKHLDSKFIRTSESSESLVDFSVIISELGVKNFNSNLKQGDLKNEINNPNFLVYESQVESIRAGTKLIHICSNSELYQRQKADLLYRAFNSNFLYDVRYVCLGQVISKDAATEIYELREKYFRYAAEQRQMIDDGDVIDSNLESLNQFSIVYDLLATQHHKDVKLSEIEIDRIPDLKVGDQASFVLYNCARLNAILDKFQSRVKQGAYDELKSVEKYNFFVLLSSDMERNLCEKYLFKMESLMAELSESIFKLDSQSSQEVKLSLAKVVRFCTELSNSFSKYYSKIHILEDPNFRHLHEKMDARVYLLKIVYSIFELILSLFDISPLKRI